MGLPTLRLKKCGTCPSRSSPPALWMLTEYHCRKCWVSSDWLLVRYCLSRPRSKKTLTGLPSNQSSTLCNIYFLIPENWGAQCCSWDLPRNRGPKSNGFNRNWTQFSLSYAQPWWRSAGLPRWSRCCRSKLLLLSSLLPVRTRRHRTSTLFRFCCLKNNWLRAGWVLLECSRWGSWQGLHLRLKFCLSEFLWGWAAWVWNSRNLSSAISALCFWDWFGNRNWGCLRSIEE